MIAAITCFFNTGQQLRLPNYRIFHEGISKEGIPLHTIELAFGDVEFQLNNSDADNLVQIRTTDVMWQKERLLNILLEDLPPQYDKVLWIDCDILYADLGWSNRIEKKLDESALIQPYTWAVSLPQCQLRSRSTANWLTNDCYGTGEIRKSFCYYACHRETYRVDGHVGYAWAARRELLDKHKFYDVVITGAGDLFMCYAAWGMFAAVDHTPIMEKFSQEICDHWFEWGLPFYLDVKKSGGPSYTDDLILHLWHGNASSRNYLQYSECLAFCHFSPNKDLVLGQDRCWKWKRKNYWLRDSIQHMFKMALNHPKVI